MNAPGAPTAADRALVLERYVDAPPEALFQAWTRPELLRRWFAPRPWSVAHAECDLRAGGASLVVMRSPDGQGFPNRGVYLEVVENRRLVFTDAFVDAWTPSHKPFMTATIRFDPEGRGTRYLVRVLHWSVADRETHETMGFHQGWGQATDQLVALVAGR